MSYFLKHEFEYRPGFRYGGGGSAGEVSFPDHMEHTHQDWLGWTQANGVTPVDRELPDVMNDVMGPSNNPLASMSYTDPSSDIDEVESEYSSWNSAIDDLDMATDWGSIMTLAHEDAAESICKSVESVIRSMDDVAIERAVKAFEDGRRHSRAEVRTRYKAGMANIGAERSSAYALGLALLEIDFNRETERFHSRLSLALFEQGMKLYENRISQSAQMILSYKEFIHEMQKQLTTILAELKRIGFVMDQEYTKGTMELNWKHSSWDLTVYKQAVAVLGGIGGGTALPDAPSKAASAIGGALSGAGTGAAIGTSLGGPGIGTAIGAVVGGIAGLL